MAVTGVATGTAGGNLTTLTLAWSALTATPAAGDLAYLVWTCGSAQTVTNDPSGWTLEGTRNSTNGSMRTRVYSRVCTGSESGSISVTASATNRQTLSVRVVRGVDTSTPVHKIAFLDETASIASHACPPVTPTIDGCVIITMMGERSSTGSTSLSTPGGSTYTVRVHSGAAAAGSGGTFSGIADDLTTAHPAGVAVTPDTLVGSAAVIGVTTWTLAIPAAAVAATGTAADALTLTDTPARTAAAARTATDTLTAGDAAAAQGSRPRTGADALALADTASRATSAARPAADALTAADAATAATATTRAATDLLALDDSTARSATATRTAADVLDLVNAAGAVTGHTAAAADTLTLADTAARALASHAAGAEAFTAGDSAAAASTRPRALDDALALDETSAATTGLRAAAADPLTLADAAAGHVTGAPPPDIPGAVTVTAASAALTVTARSSLTATGAAQSRLEVTAR